MYCAYCGIGAQRAAPSREGLSRSNDGFRIGPLLHPIDHGGQQIEIVERGGATSAMAHTRHEKQAAPTLHLIHAAVGFGHLLVVIDCIERRESRMLIPW